MGGAENGLAVSSMSFGGLPGAPWDNAREPSSRDASAGIGAAVPASEPGQRDALWGAPSVGGSQAGRAICLIAAAVPPARTKGALVWGPLPGKRRRFLSCCPRITTRFDPPAKLLPPETNPAGMRARLARSQPSRHGTLPRCLSVPHSGCSFPPTGLPRRSYLFRSYICFFPGQGV